jgi:hypothetical protein
MLVQVVWVTELKRTIGYYEKTKIFGAPLSRLCDTKSGVPAIVERLAGHLEAAKGSHARARSGSRICRLLLSSSRSGRGF